MTVEERLRENLAARFGPRGVELRSLLEEFAVEHGDDPIVQAAIPAVVAWVGVRQDKLAPLERPCDKRALKPFLRQQRELGDDPGFPSKFYLSGGALFQADGTNHLRSAEPIMRVLGEPTRPPASIRATRREIRAGNRRAVRIADRLFETARERGVWVPEDPLTGYRVLIWASRMLAHAGRLLDALSPRAVVMFAPPNIGPRVLVHVARRAGIPSVYFPHASILTDLALNDLPTDWAGLRGPGEVDCYAELIGSDDRIEVTGNPSIDAMEVPGHDPSLPPVLAPPIREADLRRVVRVVRDGVGDSVLVSPHPRSDIDLLKSLIPASWEIWTDRTFELLRRGPPALMQFESGVSLEALMLGIPTIELRLPPDRPIGYRLISEPHVQIVSDADALRDAMAKSREVAASMAARRALRTWALRWSDPVGEEAAGRGAALVSKAGSSPPRGPIWSAWPGPTQAGSA